MKFTRQQQWWRVPQGWYWWVIFNDIRCIVIVTNWQNRIISPPGDMIPGDMIPGDKIPGDMIPGDMIPGDKMCPCRWATSILPCSRTRSAVQEAQPSGFLLFCCKLSQITTVKKGIYQRRLNHQVIYWLAAFLLPQTTTVKRQYIKRGDISACSPHPICESLGENHLFQRGSEVGAGGSESSIDGRSAGRNSRTSTGRSGRNSRNSTGRNSWSCRNSSQRNCGSRYKQ